MYAQVITHSPLDELTYAIDPKLLLQVGDPVEAPFRSTTKLGFVSRVLDEVPMQSKSFKIRTISQRPENMPSLNPSSMRLLKWMGDYYQYPLGLVLDHFLPPNPKIPVLTIYKRNDHFVPPANWEKLNRRSKIKSEFINQFKSEASLLKTKINPKHRKHLQELVACGFLLVEKLTDSNILTPQSQAATNKPQLNAEQVLAVERISGALVPQANKAFLLHGVTGSGKTEVYLNCAETALKEGKSVLVMVPEIALTPQLLSRFTSRLREGVAVLHSGLKPSERSRYWQQMNNGTLRICIGARSAVFAPLRNLGLIIVDEEHDGALKQEDHLRYNGRDVALMRAKIEGCPIVLGSATPCLETFHNSKTGKYEYLVLTKRAMGTPLPDVVVVDQTKFSKDSMLTPPLAAAIRSTLEKKLQIMLLLNRRGFASYQSCHDCGVVVGCPNCSVSLTHHKLRFSLICHHCGYKEKHHERCASCGSHALNLGTPGIEALESELSQLFPSAKLLRMDRDTMDSATDFENALGLIQSGAVDIILGTQMIAKGHDFSAVHLVGVVDSDSSLNFPDFRAGERTFQLISQMSGRAGRGLRVGHVILQTHSPNHPSIVCSSTHNYQRFAEEELLLRKEFSYPPFVRLCRVLVTAPSATAAENSALRLVQQLEVSKISAEIKVIGPAPAVISKIKNMHRWGFFLKAPTHQQIHRGATWLKLNAEKLLVKGTSLQLDVDPISLL